MKFRPCIDIHNGKVKQLVGGTLRDEGDRAVENFVSAQSAADFARMYRKDGLTGGHIIMLNAGTSPYFGQTKKQALDALAVYPEGMQIGGGINDENAREYIEAGASHVIVTSFVFCDGKINYTNLKKLSEAVGREKIVLDLSCRARNGAYYVVTDRWQRFTDERISAKLFGQLSEYCDEFLIHGVDSEGMGTGMETELVELLSGAGQFKITYAGGISSFSDIQKFREISGGILDFTIGSALDIFGGELKYDVVRYIK